MVRACRGEVQLDCPGLFVLVSMPQPSISTWLQNYCSAPYLLFAIDEIYALLLYKVHKSGIAIIKVKEVKKRVWKLSSDYNDFKGQMKPETKENRD